MNLRLAAFLLTLFAATFPAFASQPGDTSTTTPIKHVIVVIAENRSFDHLFGVYQPQPGQAVFNLLSEGIVTTDGTPGPNFAKAAQYSAQVTNAFDPAPIEKVAYAALPPLMTDGAPQSPSDAKGPPFVSPSVAALKDRGLIPADLPLILTGATGLPPRTVDARLPSVNALPNGPYQLTPWISYSAYSGNPVHRFFQMWQQLDCSMAHATTENPSGCLNDLFPWVEVSVGAGSNGNPQPTPFDDRSTGEGSTAMGFYNMSQGDVPYLKRLADQFALSDNYHQAAAGGSGANHIMLGFGDMIWYSNGKGEVSTPPVNQIENPDPQPGTNNYYAQDGYKGGSYVACADSKAPGVAAIQNYLASLPSRPKTSCEPGHYYLVNNYSPGYLGNGRIADRDPFTVPPTNIPSIGDALLTKKISFRYYGEGWNSFVKSSKGVDDDDVGYCGLCNFLQYTTSIMASASRRKEHISDLDAFYDDIRNGTLPAVSFIKPSGLNDGHPASSRVDIFEAFAHRLVTAVQQRSDLWADTAIFITFDEGGGYWDSGYVQPLDFFGDGTRIPMIVVSPYATGGHISHSYADHVSILKFIEKNWNVKPISGRSRDNLPNPQTAPSNPYAPTNGPAIGDLMDMFHF
jgi:phospholipase C